MSIQQTEITSVDQLDAVVDRLMPAVLEVTSALKDLKKIMVNLPDEFAAAKFSTPGLTAAVSAIGDGGASIQISEDIPDILRRAKTEIAAAKGLGEAAATIQAEGDIKAFQPS